MEPASRKGPIRVLGIIPTFPYPPMDGYNLRIWNLYRLLGRKVTLMLLCGVYEAPPDEAVHKCHEEGLDMRIVPMRQPSRAVEFARKIGFLLNRCPIWTAGFYSPNLKGLIEDLLKRRKFDLIVVESTWLARYWPVLERSRIPMILALGDLDSEKWRRQAALLPVGRQKSYYLLNALCFRHLEQTLLSQSDLAFVTSEREREILYQRYGSRPIEVIPNGVDTDLLRPIPIVRSREMLFVGSLSYLPNTDGVLFFAREVMPELRRRYPDIRWTIVGAKTPTAVRSLQCIDGVEVVGKVQDLHPYYRRCGVCVVPIRAGSGTRLKILEAMALGRPVVATRIGCEGLDVKDRQHLLIAERPTEMIKAIEEVLTSPELCRSLVHNARILVEEKYAWPVIAEKAYQGLVKLVEEQSNG